MSNKSMENLKLWVAAHSAESFLARLQARKDPPATREEIDAAREARNAAYAAVAANETGDPDAFRKLDRELDSLRETLDAGEE